VSAIPLIVEGTMFRILVVGGGQVGTRKTLAFLASGAQIRVIAPEVSARLAAETERLQIEVREYRTGDVADAHLVVAATNNRSVNARVASDARAANRLILVADAPHEGNCAMPALHRAGDLLIAVSAGGVPTAAVRIRDALAERFDGRYAEALTVLQAMRRETLAAEGLESRREAAVAIVPEDFCDAVERGAYKEGAFRWR
jgi:precorrin-2 dehydrogenase